MSRKQKLRILIVCTIIVAILYIFSIAYGDVYANNRIKFLDDSLLYDARCKLDETFTKAYNGYYLVNSKRTEGKYVRIPKSKHDIVLMKDSAEWNVHKFLNRSEVEKDLKDVEELYVSYYDDFNNMVIPLYYSGWEIIIANKRDYVIDNNNEEILYGYTILSICPYEIGFKKQDNPYAYEYMSIDQALDSSLKYYVEHNFRKTINNDINIDDIYVSNELYCTGYKKYASDVSSSSLRTDFIKPDSVINTNDLENNKYPSEVLESSYYRVFIAKSRYEKFIYLDKYDDTYLSNAKRQITLKWLLIFTSLFLLIAIPLIILCVRINKVLNLTLYDTLLMKCNPKSFMKPYDKEKVEKANRLYARLKLCNKDDIDELKKVRKDAENELGVDFLDRVKVKELLAECNPSKLMKKYDSEKIVAANELYSKLLSNELTIDEFEEIEEKAKQADLL